MKSIVQEGSSIAKAIEKAWERAERPRSFSVKILEEPVKNFFGITTRSAKIALFFDGVDGLAQRPPAETAAARTRKSGARPGSPEDKKRNMSTPDNRTESSRGRQNKDTSAARSTPQEWQPHLVTAAQAWITEVLKLANKGQHAFTTQVRNNQLILEFPPELVSNISDHRAFFSSLNHLLIQALRNRFKHEISGLKLTLRTMHGD